MNKETRDMLMDGFLIVTIIIVYGAIFLFLGVLVGAV